MPDMIYKNGQCDWTKLQVGDIIEDVLLPEKLSLGGSVGWNARWFFRLWQIEVIEITGWGRSRKVEFGPSKITVLMPDDPHVLEYLKEHFTPTDREIMRFSDV